MKRVHLIAVGIPTILFVSILFVLNPEKFIFNQTASITFETKKFDMGKINISKIHEMEISFFNSGKRPLIIHDVKTSCGCINAVWDQNPLLAGEKGRIYISLESDFTGYFNKDIKIYSNSESSLNVINIFGEFI